MSGLEDQPFALSESDKHSPTWARIKTHLEDRVRRAHSKIEGELTEQQTANWRGHIRCLRSLLALADEPPYDG